MGGWNDKRWRGKTVFSFIIGEGSSQLAWLSSTGCALLSIGLLQIHTQITSVCACVVPDSGCVCMV